MKVIKGHLESNSLAIVILCEFYCDVKGVNKIAPWLHRKKGHFHIKKEFHKLPLCSNNVLVNLSAVRCTNTHKNLGSVTVCVLHELYDL